MKRIKYIFLAFLFGWIFANADADIINNPSKGGGSAGGASSAATILITASPYNAKCDGKTLTNVTTTSGSATVSSASYTFTAADVGKQSTSASGTTDATTTGNTTASTYVISGMASLTGINLGDYVTGANIPTGSIVVSKDTGAGGAITISKLATATASGTTLTFLAPQNTTIASVSAGSAVLSTTAGSSVSGTAFFVFGTSDSTAIQSAVNAATALPNGGTLLLPDATCVVNASITWATGVSLTGVGAGHSILKWISASDMTSSGVIHRPDSASYINPLYDNQFTYFEIDLEAATGNNTSNKGIEMPYTVRSVIDHVYVHGSPATCVATDFGNPTQITNNILAACGRLILTLPGGNGIGEGVNSTDASEQYVITGNTLINVQHDGILLETQNATTTTTAHAVISDNIILGGLDTDSTTPTASGITDAGVTGIVITSNKIAGLPGFGNWNGISVDRGTFTGPVPGVQDLIADNRINGTVAGIVLRYDAASPNPVQAAKAMIIGNNIENSQDSGIKFVTGSTNVIDTLVVNNNLVSASGRAGIFFAGTAAYNNLVIEDNTLSNNGNVTGTDVEKSGIEFATGVTNATVDGNTAFDNATGTQKYGISIVSGKTVTNAQITDNNLRGNSSVALNIVGTLASSWVATNVGYNPIGASSVTPGASPWTYTAGNTPETLYLSGGTVSNVTKNGITLATALSATSSLAVPLDPGEAVIVTYTVVPTANKDQK